MTTRNRVVLVIVLVAAVHAAAYWVCRPPREIPFNAIFSTFSQPGHRPMDRGFFPELDGKRLFGQSYGEDLQRICSDFRGNEPDIFLVRGNDLPAAVKAASLHFLGEAPPDEVIGPQDGKIHKNFWLVCYVGADGSQPPAWQMQSIRQRGNSITVRLARPPRFISTRDHHLYLAWAPLGELTPGRYYLDLINTTEGETVRKRAAVVDEHE